MSDTTQTPDTRLYSSNFADYLAARDGKPAETPAEAVEETEPVESELPEGDGADTEENEAEPTGDEAKPEEKPKKKDHNQRYSDLTREKRELQERIDSLQRELTEKSGSPQEEVQAEPQTLEKPKRPRLDQFSTTEDYEKAVDEYEDAREIYLRAQVQAEQVAELSRQQAIEARKAYAQSEETFKAATPDYTEIVSSIDDLQFGQAIHDAILSSDAKAALVYNLAKDRELAERVATLSRSKDPRDVVTAVRLVGLIEGKSLAPAAPKPRPAVVSKAPAPGRPVATKSAGPPPVDHMRGMAEATDLKTYLKHRSAYQGK